jgi:polygalacturonase
VESKFINNDGVDIDSSTDVLIENCRFNTGDDFVAIKSGRDQDGWRVNKPSKNIVIRNSFSDDCLHGISFGSELSGGIENVFVENLVFKKVRKYGLQFKSNKDRGGYIKNVVIKGIQIDTTQTCISFTNQYHSYSGGNYPSLFENIRIENMNCKVAHVKAISMQGLPEMPIRNVVLKNVNVKEAGEKSFITYVVDMEWNNIVIGNKFSF